MRILLITGGTGSGKTRLIEKRSNCHLIDPLGMGFITWQEPVAFCEVVAFDHVSHLQNANKEIAAAQAWCEAHNKPLWLIENSRKNIEERDVDLQGRIVELQISNDENEYKTWEIFIEGKATTPTHYTFGKLIAYGLQESFVQLIKTSGAGATQPSVSDENMLSKIQ